MHISFYFLQGSLSQVIIHNISSPITPIPEVFHWAYVTLKLGYFYSTLTKILYFDLIILLYDYFNQVSFEPTCRNSAKKCYRCYCFFCFILYLFCASRFASLWHPHGHRKSESATHGVISLHGRGSLCSGYTLRTLEWDGLVHSRVCLFIQKWTWGGYLISLILNCLSIKWIY